GDQERLHGGVFEFSVVSTAGWMLQRFESIEDEQCALAGYQFGEPAAFGPRVPGHFPSVAEPRERLAEEKVGAGAALSSAALAVETPLENPLHALPALPGAARFPVE